MARNFQSRIRILLALALSSVCLPRVDAQSDIERTPLWTMNLSQQWGLRPFETDIRLTWTRQQGVTFITPQRLVVYQVNELKTPAALAGRDASGGGGNFLLEARVFDVQDGHVLKTFSMRTSAELSTLLPTRDGKFILRTGDVVYVMSPTFETVASRKLPLVRLAPQELWQVEVSPSGQQAVLVHQQIFSRGDPYLGKPWQGVAEVEVINADTLAATKSFTVQHPLRVWSATDEFLVTPDPSSPEQESRFGLLDFSGHWTAFPVEGSCQYEMTVLSSRSIAAYGCGKLLVLSDQREKLFSANIQVNEFVGSVDRSADLLAVELDTGTSKFVPEINFSIRVPKPLRIEVYQIATGKHLLSVPVQSENVYYAISPQGVLAIVDGSVLKAFQLSLEGSRK